MLSLKVFPIAATLSVFLLGIDAGHFITERWAPSLPTCTNTTDFVYAGCFVDPSSPSALLFRPTDLNSQNMTVGICVDFCKGNGYKYAGLEYYGECFCGASVGGPQTAESNCSFPCTGNKNESCGGNDIISVYQDTTFPTVDDATISDYTPMGCYSDLGPNGRTLAWKQDQIPNAYLTIESCLNACKEGGYPFAGVEYSQECYCGVVLGNGTAKVDEANCQMPCNGNATELCGGAANLYLYVAKDLLSTDPCNGNLGSPVSSSMSSYSSTSSSSASPASSTIYTTTSSTLSSSSSSYPSSSSSLSSSSSSSSSDTSSSAAISTPAYSPPPYTPPPYAPPPYSSSPASSSSFSSAPVSLYSSYSSIPSSSSYSSSAISSSSSYPSAPASSSSSSSSSPSSPAASSTSSITPSSSSAYSSSSMPSSTYSSTPASSSSSSYPSAPASSPSSSSSSSYASSPASSSSYSSSPTSSSPSSYSSSPTSPSSSSIPSSSSSAPSTLPSIPSAAPSSSSSSEISASASSSPTPISPPSSSSPYYSPPATSSSYPLAPVSSSSAAPSTFSTPGPTPSASSSSSIPSAPPSPSSSTAAPKSPASSSSTISSTISSISAPTSTIYPSSPSTSTLSSSSLSSAAPTSSTTPYSPPTATQSSPTSVSSSPLTSSSAKPSTTPSPTTSKTSATLCTSITSITPTSNCEYKVGNWCSKPLPPYSDQTSCLAASSTCLIQLTSCLLSAGFPASLECLDFSSWCQQISTYCLSYCPGPSCSNTGYNSRYPPPGYTPPTISTKTSIYACPTTIQTTSKPTTTTTSIAPLPTCSNICAQPNNPSKGYGSYSPVGSIPLPCYTCNNLQPEYSSGYPFKLYTAQDSANSPRYSRPNCGQGCQDACEAQYTGCVETYARSCLDGGLQGDTYEGALVKCEAQKADCYVTNEGVSGGGRCTSYDSGY